MKVLIAVIVIAIAAVIGFSTKNPEKKVLVQELPHIFYYYPKANMYYDSTAASYIYLSNDGKTWQTTNQLTAGQKATLGKSVLLKNPPSPVWKDNEQHRIIYSAALYAAPSDLASKSSRQGNIKSKQKITGKKNNPKKNKAHENKIDRFFKKIFGGSKKHYRYNIDE